MKKVFRLLGMVFLIVMSMIATTSCGSSNEKSTYIQTIDKTPLEDMDFENTFDYYEIISNEKVYGINAYTYASADYVENIVALSFNEADEVRVTYSIEFSFENMQVNMLTMVFDDSDTLMYIEECVGNPIFYDNGDYDVVFIKDGIEVYLSDIIDSQDSCFFLSLFISSVVAAKIVAACIAVAKITAVVVGTIIVLGVTYELVNVTREFINEKIKEAEIEKSKKDKPQIYRNARLNSSGKLIISATAVDIDKASAGMKTSQSYWVPLFDDAKKLCISASGGYTGPEIDREYNGSPRKGYYWHCHCLNRAYNSHCWYGTPYAQVY